MDEESIKKQGIKPLREILHQVADLFPVTESSFMKTLLNDKDDIKDTILYLQKIGVSSLISCGAGADDKDPDVVVVQVSPPYSVGLAKDYYSDNDVVQKYEDAIAQIIANFHPDEDNSTLHNPWIRSMKHDGMDTREMSKDLAHELVEFEKKLAAASPDPEDADDVTVSFPEARLFLRY
jgi:endothelin-converting enzyme